MPEISRSQFAVYAAIVVVVVFVGSRALGAKGAAGASVAPAAAAHTPASTVRVARTGGGAAVVHVAGAVRRPGVYRLPEGSRVQDAVRRAGGRAAGADVDAINLAARVADGQQVVVPRRVAAGASAPPPAAGGAGAAAPGGTVDSGAPVSLNTATAEQLDTLDGVGPATAQKILEYRAQHGGFRSVDDLGQIPGIGPKRLAALRPRVQP